MRMALRRGGGREMGGGVSELGLVAGVHSLPKFLIKIMIITRIANSSILTSEPLHSLPLLADKLLLPEGNRLAVLD